MSILPLMSVYLLGLSRDHATFFLPHPGHHNQSEEDITFPHLAAHLPQTWRRDPRSLCAETGATWPLVGGV